MTDDELMEVLRAIETTLEAFSQTLDVLRDVVQNVDERLGILERS